FAVPSEEVKGISRRIPPKHINRAHSRPHEGFPAIDHNPNKASTAPAFFMAKTCDRSTPGGCQNATNWSFQWVVGTFTWNGPTGAYSEQLVKTDVGSRQNKW